MAEVFAGLLCGFIAALVLTPLLAIALLKMRATSALLARLLPPGTSAAGLMVIVNGGMAFFWTAIGILLGLVLKAMNSGTPRHFLLSRNAAFTLFVAGVVLALAAPIAFVALRYRAVAIAGAAGMVLLFGWLMPYLADWSKFD